MYKCNNCRIKFEEPDTLNTTYEAFYGVSSLFPNYTHLDMQVCPRCNDDDFSEVKRCENCEKWVEDAIEIEDSNLCEECYDELNAS